MRVALYYAPEITDPLWDAGCAWLGRDAETGGRVPQPHLEGIEAATASPRLYGFHCTLKAPMRINASYAEFAAAAEAAIRAIEPFTMPPLRVTEHHGFLCLRETGPSPALDHLAAAGNQALDRFRVPPDDAELARRRKAGLTPEQERMLLRFGYPHAGDTWFFHMTLTGRLDARQHATFRPPAEAHFAASLAAPRAVAFATLFTQAAPGEPFLIAERLPLGCR